MENLPDELRTEILLRSPIKSLACLKCVSKSWLSLISDPNFPQLHFKRSPQHYTHDRFPYFVHSDHHDHTHLRIRAIDLNASSHNDAAAISFDFPTDYKVILASCLGFLLLLHKQRDKLLVWNPSTGEHKQILLPQKHTTFNLHGFCYDESTDDYLIVLVSLMERLPFRVFSIRNNSWNKFALDGQETMMPHHPVVPGLAVNGVIHWLVSFLTAPGLPQVSILAFNIKTNQARRVVLNLDDTEVTLNELTLCHLRLFGESLALIDVLSNHEEIKVWVTKECGGKPSSWTKLMSIPRSPEASDYFSPLFFTKDGRLVTLHSPLTLSKWTSEGKLDEDIRCNGYPYVKGFHYAATPVFTETLFSLPSTQ